MAESFGGRSEFLVTAEDGTFFDKFVTHGLGPERELVDLVQSKITERSGEIRPIEARMLRSIADVCRKSGVKIEDISRKHGDWAGGVRARLDKLGKAEAYVAMIRIPSHAVHGNWVDILKNHLEFDESTGLFSPASSFSHVDERGLGPVALVVLDATGKYLLRHFAGNSETDLLSARMDNLMDRIIAVGESHEKLLNVHVAKENG